MAHDVFPEVLCNIQLIQDVLSERLDVFLVLIDQNFKEATLPSKLPLICYENAFTDEKCKNCMINSIKKYTTINHDDSIYKCHRGLYYTVLKCNFLYTDTLYLISGRTRDLSKLKNDLCLLKPLFQLPVNLVEKDTTYPHKQQKDSSIIIHGLTQQELNVLSHLVDGLSNKDIADKLCISLSTVKTHIAHILSKLKVNNRTEASIYAIQQGLIRKSKK